MSVVHQLVLGVTIRNARIEDRTEDTRYVVFVQKPLVSIDDFDVLIVIVNELVLLADLVKRVLRFRITRSIDHLLDKVLVPSLGVDLCTNLFGSHVHHVENVGCFLRVNRVVRPKDVLVRGQRFYPGAAHDFSRNRNGSLTVFA